MIPKLRVRSHWSSSKNKTELLWERDEEVDREQIRKCREKHMRKKDGEKI